MITGIADFEMEGNLGISLFSWKSQFSYLVSKSDTLVSYFGFGWGKLIEALKTTVNTDKYFPQLKKLKMKFNVTQFRGSL